MAGLDEPDDPEDEVSETDDRSFLNRPLWQRVAMIAAGPAMNFLLAILLLSGYFAFVVIPPTVQGVVPNSPAHQGITARRCHPPSRRNRNHQHHRAKSGGEK